VIRVAGKGALVVGASTVGIRWNLVLALGRNTGFFDAVAVFDRVARVADAMTDVVTTDPVRVRHKANVTTLRDTSAMDSSFLQSYKWQLRDISPLAKVKVSFIMMDEMSDSS